MPKSVNAGQLFEALEKLGFSRTSRAPFGIVFRHDRTDTVFIFPHATVRVTPQRVASVRRLITGRGVATAKRFNSLLGNVPPLAMVG